MTIDFSKIVSELGDDLIAQQGEHVGLDREQSVRVADALARNFSKGREGAVEAAAAETGLTEEVIAAMAGKLIEVGKEKLLNEGPVADAIASAQVAAGDAMKKAAGGMFSGLFGRKAG